MQTPETLADEIESKTDRTRAEQMLLDQVRSEQRANKRAAVGSLAQSEVHHVIAAHCEDMLRMVRETLNTKLNPTQVQHYSAKECTLVEEIARQRDLANEFRRDAHERFPDSKNWV